MMYDFVWLLSALSREYERHIKKVVVIIIIIIIISINIIFISISFLATVPVHWIKHYGHENKGNDRKLKQLYM